MAHVLKSCPNPVDDAKLICSATFLYEAAVELLRVSLQPDSYAEWRPVPRERLEALQAAVDMAHRGGAE